MGDEAARVFVFSLAVVIGRRQVQPNDKALRMGVVCRGVAAVLSGDTFDQGQAEAGAAGVCVVGSPEALEHTGQLFGRDAGTVVDDFEDDGIQVGRVAAGFVSAAIAVGIAGLLG